MNNTKIKQLSKEQNLNVIKFSSKKKRSASQIINNYENIKDSYKYIKRLDGKFLNTQDKQVFDLLWQLTKNGPVDIDYPWLEEKLNKSQSTVQRTLTNLSTAFSKKFHNVLMKNGRKIFNRLVIQRTAELEKILTEAVEELEKNRNKKRKTNISRGMQKCIEGYAKMHSSYIEVEGIEEEPYGSSSSIPTRERSEEKRTTLATGSLNEPAKVTSSSNVTPFPQKPKLLTADAEKNHYQQHSYRNPNLETKSYLNQEAIVEGQKDKLSPEQEQMPELSKTKDLEAEIKPIAFPETSQNQNCLLWEKFEKDLNNYFPPDMAKHAINVWFNKVKVTQILSSNKLILTGSDFIIDSIFRRFESTIEYITMTNKITVELHFESNNAKPIIFTPKERI